MIQFFFKVGRVRFQMRCIVHGRRIRGLDNKIVYNYFQRNLMNLAVNHSRDAGGDGVVVAH